MQEFTARWGESATSVDFVDEQKDILVYPNPFSDKVTLELESSKFNVLVYNSLGVLVSSFDDCGYTLQIDTGDWTSGVYHLTVQDEDTGQQISTKLIK